MRHPPLVIISGMNAAMRPNKLAVMAADIKLSHSVFALPFAFLAAFMAAGGQPGAEELGLILVCMVFARTFAMLANRYVDREIDKRNPRTAGRALPSGRLTPKEVRLGMAVCGFGLIVGAAMFGVMNGNWWPVTLSPAVLVWLGAYGLMKRFTLLCHFFLGAALAISAPAAGLAIDPASLGEPTLWWLSAFILLWVGGFDVIYGLQDVEADRRDGLHSIPSRLGRANALLIAKSVHLLALVALVLSERQSDQLGSLTRIGIAIVAALLIVEHAAAARGRFSMAFFTVNGVISLVLGGLGIADVINDAPV